MRSVPLVLAALFLLLPARAEEVHRYRQYIAGQALGGMEVRRARTPEGERMESREWLRLSRLGMDIEQNVLQTAVKAKDGSLRFTWRLQMSQEPFEGEATWSPQAPKILRLRPKGGAPSEVAVPEGALLWPGDVDDRLMAAARARSGVRIQAYSFPTQQWTELDLQVQGPAPLPGFQDAVRFTGADVEGPVRMDVESWISPTQGELRHAGSLAGLPLLTQREELPEPATEGAAPSFFDASLKKLPPHPFLMWLPEVAVKWTGKELPKLPEDEQQHAPEPGRLRLRRALPPSAAEAAEAPVKGRPAPEDARFLAATPLVQFEDPAFDGLVHRLRPPKGASRWELARRVTSFVYDWITEKDFSVGFASALEVAHTPKGDCTEHGVLAVALLRKLGVPSRGVVGWVALEQTLGLHFWVEVRLKGRWVPVDPTFDLAPASAFRIKLGTTDLADLGSVGWDGASQTFAEGSWSPEGPWAAELRVVGDLASAPGGSGLRYPGGTWSLREGRLRLNDRWEVEATLPPPPAVTRAFNALAAGARHGWWQEAGRKLLVDLGAGRWVQVGSVGEGEAYEILEGLSFQGTQ